MKTTRPLLAAGIGQPGESHPIRPRQKRLFRPAHLTPWSSRMRSGWVLGWDGPFWHNPVGIAGPDWDGGHWPGGHCWHQHSPPVVCRVAAARLAALRPPVRPEHGLLLPA